MSNPNANPPDWTKWKKGQSGNPAGRVPKGQTLTDLMREYLENVSDRDLKLKNKDEFVKKVFEFAMKGDPAFAKFVFQYIEGEPTQRLQLDVLHKYQDQSDEELIEAILANGSMKQIIISKLEAESKERIKERNDE